MLNYVYSIRRLFISEQLQSPTKFTLVMEKCGMLLSTKPICLRMRISACSSHPRETHRGPIPCPRHRFYVLQVLHPIGNDSTCLLFTRWGRVGEAGASQRKVGYPFIVTETASYNYLQGPFSAPIAVSEFKKQFKSKTATNWESRRSMTSVKSGKIQRTLYHVSF